MEITYDVALAVLQRRDTRHNYDVNRLAGPLLSQVSQVITNRQMHQDFSRFRPVRSADFHRFLWGHGIFVLSFSSTFASSYEANLT